MVNNNSAILITAYNRYENFKKIFKKVIKFDVNLYISIDGPKNYNDKVIQKKIIDLINRKINKRKKGIKYQLLKQNYGCRKAVFLGIGWFFEKEKKGIFLEDDVMPSNTFFQLSNQLLIKYKNKKNIFSICGYNFASNLKIESDYFFSKYFFSGGFATWKDRWKLVERNNSNQKIKNILNTHKWKTLKEYDLEEKYYKKIFDKILKKKINSWAFIWNLIAVANNSQFVVPKKNLISNTGINTIGANNVPSKFKHGNFKTYNFSIKKHPSDIKRNKIFDYINFKYNFRPKNFLYPWRVIFILKSFLFDTKFFLLKLKQNLF